MVDEEILKRAKALEAAIRIGKGGMNDNVAAEITKLIKKRKIVKVKILNNCEMDKEDVIRIALEKTGATLVQKIGKVFVLHKR